MGPKKRKKRCKVIWQTPFARAITSYRSKREANDAAKALRASAKTLPKDVRRGVSVHVEEE